MSLVLITDRTGADVSNAKMLRLKIQSGSALTETEKSAFERGTCTKTMLNRIETAQKTLAEDLNNLQYKISISNKTDWTYTDIFDNANYERLLNNLEKLKDAFFTYPTTPQTPSYMYGFKEANDIEKILFDIEQLIEEMKKNYIKCGTIQCGGELL